MAYHINTDCISCGACAAECPVSAISEGDSIYVIDADTCIDCGACHTKHKSPVNKKGGAACIALFSMIRYFCMGKGDEIDAVRWRTLGTYFKSISNYCVETALF